MRRLKPDWLRTKVNNHEGRAVDCCCRRIGHCPVAFCTLPTDQTPLRQMDEKAIFVGDLVDRGPRIPVGTGSAYTKNLSAEFTSASLVF